MSQKHYTVKNTLGGEFCKKCFNWSNIIGGLEKYERCKATKEQIKENIKIYKSRNN